MNEKDTKLLQAKQLLKKYQNKKDESFVSSTNGSQLNSGGFNGDSHSEVGSLPSSRASSTVICEQNPQIFNHFAANEQQEIEFLRRTIEEKDKSLKDVFGKLQNLQTHYASLHGAYMTAVQANSNGAPPEFADQLAKLQTALSVAIEEKTSYQSQLRTANAKLQGLEADNKDMHVMLKATTGSSTLHETEKRKLREEIDQLALKWKKTLEELEKHRAETLAMESKLRGISQDRMDLQARLKYIFNEKDELEKQLSEARHSLEMKEIFIKQLTYANPAQGENIQQALTTLTNEKERLTFELSKVNETLAESERQQKATRDYYESCVIELNSKITEYEERLRSISIEKADLEATRNSLEDKLNYLISQQANNTIPHIIQENPIVSVQQQVPQIPQFDPVEIQALKNSLTAMQSDCSRAADRIRELEILVQEREVVIEKLEKSLAIEQTRTENLRNEVENQKTVNSDVHSLLEQLQNEKATVSRAIAQNIELKEQLGELQDKFIEVTNESALREEQKQSAFAAIDRLQQQLDLLINERNNPLKKERSDGIVQTDLEKEPKVEFVPKADAGQQTEFTFAQTIVSEATENMKNGTEDGDHVNININVPEPPTERPVDHNLDVSNDSPPPFSSSSATSSSISLTPSVPRDEIIRQLETKLEALANEKKEIQIANDKLQYFLTALESENESIGEYIALYRFQRQTIQKRAAEKDSLISQLDFEKKAAQAQIRDLQKVLYNLFGQSPPVLTAIPDGEKSHENNGEVNQEKNGEVNQENNNGLIVEKLNQIILEIRHKQHRSSLDTDSNEFVDPKLHCPECRGQMFTL
ncbi:hypothetical protein FO519_004795 [Halicephalobus sp. NKZ332]|nr:hypothetical protein FO519_004795 [Halicephalobus sp. NKZ332]